MPITISYGNPALVGAASFGIGREKGRQKAGAKAADMAQGMLDRRDAKRDDARNRYDRLRKENADRNQRSAIEAGRIAQDQDEARMRGEAAKNKADQRARERAEDFDFRQKSQQAGFDQRDREAAARAAAARAAREGAIPPPSRYFPPSSGGGGGGMPSGMPSGGATYPDGRPVPPSLQSAIDQATGKRTAEYDPYGKDRPVDSTGGTPPPMALPPNAPRSPAVSEMGGFPQSTQEDADILNRSSSQDRMAGLDPRFNPDGSVRADGSRRTANSRGFVPQRTMGAQRAMAGRQQRYAREEADRRALSAGQQKSLTKLNAYQDQIMSGATTHLDEEQKQSALNQIEQEQQMIQQNPSGSETPTLDNMINGAIANVNVGGQQLPMVMGENGQPQVLSGYTPPQAGDGSMLQDTVPEGFVPDRNGAFSTEEVLTKDEAEGLAFTVDNQKYETNILRSGDQYKVQIKPRPAEQAKPEKAVAEKPDPSQYQMPSMQDFTADNKDNITRRLENQGIDDPSPAQMAQEGIKYYNEFKNEMDSFNNPSPNTETHAPRKSDSKRKTEPAKETPKEP